MCYNEQNCPRRTRYAPRTIHAMLETLVFSGNETVKYLYIIYYLHHTCVRNINIITYARCSPKRPFILCYLFPNAQKLSQTQVTQSRF